MAHEIKTQQKKKHVHKIKRATLGTHNLHHNTAGISGVSYFLMNTPQRELVDDEFLCTLLARVVALFFLSRKIKSILGQHTLEYMGIGD
jgi:hypothetical protein